MSILCVNLIPNWLFLSMSLADCVWTFWILSIRDRSGSSWEMDNWLVPISLRLTTWYVHALFEQIRLNYYFTTSMCSDDVVLPSQWYSRSRELCYYLYNLGTSWFLTIQRIWIVLGRCLFYDSKRSIGQVLFLINFIGVIFEAGNETRAKIWSDFGSDQMWRAERKESGFCSYRCFREIDVWKNFL